MDRVVFLTTQEIHFHQYFDSVDTDDTGLCTIFLCLEGCSFHIIHDCI